MLYIRVHNNTGFTIICKYRSVHKQFTSSSLQKHDLNQVLQKYENGWFYWKENSTQSTEKWQIRNHSLEFCFENTLEDKF